MLVLQMRCGSMVTSAGRRHLACWRRLVTSWCATVPKRNTIHWQWRWTLSNTSSFSRTKRYVPFSFSVKERTRSGRLPLSWKVTSKFAGCGHSNLLDITLKLPVSKHSHLPAHFSKGKFKISKAFYSNLWLPLARCVLLQYLLYGMHYCVPSPLSGHPPVPGCPDKGS